MARGGRRAGEPGWLISLLGAAVLIVAGFAIGLLAGVVSEEPELVVGHLAGRSEEVSWRADPDPADESVEPHEQPAVAPQRVALGGRQAQAPDPFPARNSEPAGEWVDLALPSVGEAPPAVAAPPPVAAAPAVAAAVRGVPGARSIDELPKALLRRQPVASPAATQNAGTFAVQVGAFADPVAAGRVRDELVRKGFDVYLVSGKQSADGKSRVRVGPVASRADADALADRLKREERLPTWVLVESGS